MLFYKAYRRSTNGDCYIIATSESLDDIQKAIREDVIKHNDSRTFWWELDTMDYNNPFEIISKSTYI
jgi:hypothetical protein